MTDSPHRPHWRLPPGVTRGLWDYVHSLPVAEDYDEYFAHNRLFAFDEQVILRHVSARGLGVDSIVADLGCGTGRAIVPLVRRGFRGLAVDLSEPMLDVVRRKAAADDLAIQCVQANLVELDCIGDECVDVVLLLFSTLGMIRGRENRHRVLAHARRILKPEGLLVLHVHNFWFNLRDPGGPWWVFRNSLRAAWSGDVEQGDKFFDYRGVPKMFLHVFTPGELRRMLRDAGFRPLETIPLDPRRHRALRWPWLLRSLRANGWIVVCS